MEWSVDEETEIWVQSSSWLWFGNITIKDLPLLVESIVSAPDDNISVFLINCSVNIEYLTFLIDNVISTQSEELEPSRISAPDLEI